LYLPLNERLRKLLKISKISNNIFAAFVSSFHIALFVSLVKVEKRERHTTTTAERRQRCFVFERDDEQEFHPVPNFISKFN
jgi:hypothetical protein